MQNLHAGPDFFDARIEVSGQLWAGNVEMHLKSSDWYAHHHETDINYDNVILHVVWDDDMEVFRKDGSRIPTLELKNVVSPELLEGYQQLLYRAKPVFINCEKNFNDVDDFRIKNWFERLYVERLEQKSVRIQELLESTNNDWEAVLFAMLLKNFGSKINGEFFLDKGLQLDFSIVRKTSANSQQLESLFYGHLGLLAESDCTDTYYLQLQKEYRYLRQKFGLDIVLEKPKFFGLRPANFPTIRLSQLANLYGKHQNLFAMCMQSDGLDSLYGVLESMASDYWDNHFTFGKVSKKSKKKLSKSFKDLLIINTIIPLKFCHAKHLGKDWNEAILFLISKIKPEQNSIINAFNILGRKTGNALESQAKIQLYNNYCTKNKCLQCAIGAHLLNRNTYF